MAVAFRKIDKLNKLSPKVQPLFPKTSQATRLASIAPPANTSISVFAAADLTASSLVGFPPNLLMVPFGKTTGAIADLMDVSYDEKANSITLQLDVVQNPVIFSQFVDHAPHSVDTTAAHYHLSVRDGMHVDAPAVLKGFKDSSYNVEGRRSHGGGAARWGRGGGSHGGVRWGITLGGGQVGCDARRC